MSEQMSKAELLAAMQREYERMEEMIGALSEAQLTLPGIHADSHWTIKDTMAHLTVWMRRTVETIPGRTRSPDPISIPPGEDSNQTVDRLNQYYYEQAHPLPLGAVLADFRKAYREIRSAVDGLSEDQVQDPALYSRIVNNSSDHFREHMDVIEPWRARQQ